MELALHLQFMTWIQSGLVPTLIIEKTLIIKQANQSALTIQRGETEGEG